MWLQFEQQNLYIKVERDLGVLLNCRKKTFHLEVIFTSKRPLMIFTFKS